MRLKIHTEICYTQIEMVFVSVGALRVDRSLIFQVVGTLCLSRSIVANEFRKKMNRWEWSSMKNIEFPFGLTTFPGCLIPWHEKHRAKSSVAPEFTPSGTGGNLKSRAVCPLSLRNGSTVSWTDPTWLFTLKTACLRLIAFSPEQFIKETLSALTIWPRSHRTPVVSLY